MKFSSKRHIVIICTSLVVLMGFYLYLSKLNKNHHKDINLPIRFVESNYAIWNNVDELFEYADLVVVGKPLLDIEESAKRTSEIDHRVADFYSLTPFQISQVLKGGHEGPEVTVIQPAAVFFEENGEKFILANEDYTPMIPGLKYILFLKNTNIGAYSIIAINQGKHNVDDRDRYEKDIKRKNKQLSQLHEQVMNKYKDKIKS